MIEEWKPIEGYEGLYEISSFGRVKSLARSYNKVDKRWGGTYIVRVPEKILKPSINRVCMYPKYGLTKHEVPRNISYRAAHRLVAEHFIPNPNNLPTVNHKDHDKTNPKIDNLEWVTAKGNTQAAIKAGVFSKGVRQLTKFTDKQVEWIVKLEDLGFSDQDLQEIFATSKAYLQEVTNS